MASTTSKSLKINKTDVANTWEMRKRKFVTNASDTQKKKNMCERTEIRHIHHIHTFFVHFCLSFPFHAHSIHRNQLINTIACVRCAKSYTRLNPSEYLSHALQSELPISLSGVFIRLFFHLLSIWLLSYLLFVGMLHPSDGIFHYTSSPNIFALTPTSARASLFRSLGRSVNGENTQKRDTIQKKGSIGYTYTAMDCELRFVGMSLIWICIYIGVWPYVPSSIEDGREQNIRLNVKTLYYTENGHIELRHGNTSPPHIHSEELMRAIR